MDVAIIVAGGTGQRMQSATPKQYLSISGKPIVVHTAEAFMQYSKQLRCVLVLPGPPDAYWETIKEHLPQAMLVEGGSTRFHSVKNGLAGIGRDDIVAVHDGVRPLVSRSTIQSSFESARKYGSGVAAVPAKDSLRKGSMDNNTAIARATIFQVQTPQTFSGELLLKAFEQPYQENFTDDASVVESSGHRIHLVDGDYGNIKITTQEDLAIAEALLG